MKLMPTCQEVNDHLTDLDEGVLPIHRVIAYRVHLLICKSCQAAFRGLKALPFLGKTLLCEQEPLPKDCTERIMTRLMRRLKEDHHAHPHG
jgi:hypothetical protein